jgi:hypothetical protein
VLDEAENTKTLPTNNENNLNADEENEKKISLDREKIGSIEFVSTVFDYC